MIRWEAGRQVNLGFIIAGIALALSGFCAFQSAREESSSKRWVSHALEVEHKTESLLNGVTNAETGQRGFLLTGRQSYLEPYRKALANTSFEFKALQELVVDPDQKARLTELWPLIEQKYAELESTVALKRAGRTGDALKIVLTDRGANLMSQIRDKIQAFRGAEDEILLRRIELDQSYAQRVFVFVPIGSLIALVTLLFSAIKVNRDIENRRLGELARARASELEERTRKFQEASRLKGEFLANMSHELRTPLNAIIGFASLMHQEKVGSVSADQKEYLGDILTSSRHLLQLINDILDLSKVEAGKIEFRPEPLDLSKLVAEVRDIMRGLAAEKRIEVATDVAPELSSVTLDPGRLKQVLYNYFSNAIKFTPEGGKVTINFSAEPGDRLRLDVVDSGIGIKPEDLDRLFVEFQQLDGGTDKKYAGTGLGLALTKRIVEAQGGTVSVKSTPGLGTTFSATLPRQMSELKPASIGSAVPETLRGGPAVLVIEDDPQDREWLVQTLGRAGYSVEAVATCAAALESCRRKSFAAVTLDLLLPDASGWQVLSEIRATPLNRTVPTIIVSVSANKGVGSGFTIHDYLVKPVRESDLLASLTRANIAHRSGPVLVVDDDVGSQKLNEILLKQLGFRCVCKTSGEDALLAVEQDPPAVIVLDLLLPGMSGFEFLTRLRRTETGARIPIIVWSVKDLTEVERSWLREGAQAVVVKGEDGTAKLVEELRFFLKSAS